MQGKKVNRLVLAIYIHEAELALESKIGVAHLNCWWLELGLWGASYGRLDFRARLVSNNHYDEGSTDTRVMALALVSSTRRNI